MRELISVQPIFMVSPAMNGLRYLLDPKEVHGEDFPGETFRVLKEKEIKQFGEYRTRRLVLEAWDELGGA
jgi:hypothetical protein